MLDQSRRERAETALDRVIDAMEAHGWTHCYDTREDARAALVLSFTEVQREHAIRVRLDDNSPLPFSSLRGRFGAS